MFTITLVFHLLISYNFKTTLCTINPFHKCSFFVFLMLGPLIGNIYQWMMFLYLLLSVLAYEILFRTRAKIYFHYYPSFANIIIVISWSSFYFRNTFVSECFNWYIWIYIHTFKENHVMKFVVLTHLFLNSYESLGRVQQEWRVKDWSSPAPSLCPTSVASSSSSLRSAAYLQSLFTGQML